ncbi:MAG TPA: hypothetical protein VHK69_00275, partial [Chitinophagaceae bacterium]|nr:hypothetical protein [Chitinophagaceae bacterium]
TLRAEGKTVVDYFFPRPLGSDSLVYLKSGYRNVPTFYLKDRRGEHRIRQRSISTEEWFTVSGSRLLYTAQAVNPRWSLVSYSDIVELDLATGRERRLTRNRRYFTPSPAPSGTRMVAVEYSDSLRTYLAELSAGGDPLRRVAAPEGALFVHPAYIGEEQVVTALRWPDSRMSLEQVDLATGNRQTLVPPGVYTIGHPAVSGNRIIFTASFGGNDDLYALTRKDQNLFRLTSGSTGHYFPSVRGDSLYWSQFTATGYKIRSRSLDDLAGEAINPLMLGEEVLPFPVADRSPNLLDTADRPFPVSAYKGTEGWFRFHSWRPDYSDPEVTLTLASDNVLGNFSTDVFYRYNRADQSHGTGFNVRYGGFYPVLSAGAEYTFGRNVPLGNSTYLLDQAEARAGYSIPLNFTFGKTYKQLLFGTNATINQLLPRGLLKDSIADRTTPYLHHFVQWLHQRPRALQQIFPKWGYGFTLQHRHRLDAAGYQLAGSGQAYLPSAGNHSLVLSGAFQQVDTNNVLFSNRFS